MDRRTFLRRSSILAAGAIAADQIELLERLTHERKFFPGWSERVYIIDTAMVQSRPPTASRLVQAIGNSGTEVVVRTFGGATQRASVLEMDASDFRRKYGLKTPALAFRADGSWV